MQAGRGIGQQAAFSLAEAGARAIIFADMNEETATASAEESKQYATHKEYQATAFKVNVTDEKGVQDMVVFVVKQFGRVDYAVNGAGVSQGLLSLFPLCNLLLERFFIIRSLQNNNFLDSGSTRSIMASTPRSLIPTLKASIVS